MHLTLLSYKMFCKETYSYNPNQSFSTFFSYSWTLKSSLGHFLGLFTQKSYPNYSNKYYI